MFRKIHVSTWIVLSICLSLLPACEKKQETQAPAPMTSAAPSSPQGAAKPAPKEEVAEGASFIKIPLGLDTNLNFPKDNPPTPEKVELGRLLYFDKRLSKDGTISCATCHNPKQGWTDNEVVSTGFHNLKGTRSAPTVINATYMLSQFWDGRAKDLEEQSLGPIINPVEMAHTHEGMVANLNKISGYAPLFQKAFGDPTISKERVAMAIASFERTVLGGNSRYDRYSKGDKTAMNESEIRGMNLFFGKANCTRCHVGSNFSDSDFHNLGVGMDKPKPDLGRFQVTKEEKDKGAFKTPTVRDITKTFPYMHDGSEKSLEEVVEFYDKGGSPNPHLDAKIVKLNLSPQEKADLVAFLKALDSEPYPMVEEPKLP
jgi:cytochrome c peroxidase